MCRRNLNVNVYPKTKQLTETDLYLHTYCEQGKLIRQDVFTTVLVCFNVSKFQFRVFKVETLMMMTILLWIPK